MAKPLHRDAMVAVLLVLGSALTLGLGDADAARPGALERQGTFRRSVDRASVFRRSAERREKRFVPRQRVVPRSQQIKRSPRYLAGLVKRLARDGSDWRPDASLSRGWDLVLGRTHTQDRPSDQFSSDRFGARLDEFGSEVSSRRVLHYLNWVDAGLTGGPAEGEGLEGFGPRFALAMDRTLQFGGQVHVDLTDLAPSSLRSTGRRPSWGSITNWEVGQVLDNPRWLLGTTFYERGPSGAPIMVGPLELAGRLRPVLKGTRAGALPTTARRFVKRVASSLRKGEISPTIGLRALENLAQELEFKEAQGEKPERFPREGVELRKVLVSLQEIESVGRDVASSPSSTDDRLHSLVRVLTLKNETPSPEVAALATRWEKILVRGLSREDVEFAEEIAGSGP